MARKLTVILLIVGLCLMGVIPGLAQKTYPTLAEYEKLTGKSIEAFNEAPSLKAKVAVGELPPLEERLPEEPMVVEPLEEIGKYGGTLRGGTLGPMRFGDDTDTCRGEGLLTSSPDLSTIFPNVVRSWDISEDLKALTVHLRKGMKWSDGAPFTADDFVFAYEDIEMNSILNPVPNKLWAPIEKGGRAGKVEKIDDYTVRFRFAIPCPVFINECTFGSYFAPEHYLKKFHIKYNPKADEMARKSGFDSWWKWFVSRYPVGGKMEKTQDVNVPTIGAWMLREIDSYGNRYYVRNPYYWKIDTAGNQLPYIDEESDIVVENIEVLDLKTIAGEFNIAAAHTRLKNYPLYKEGEKKGNYSVKLWKEARGSACEVGFNLTHKDPVLRKIFNDIRFRQAMSLAINRDEINQILFFGKAVPRPSAVNPGASFHEDWMEKYYVEYDPKRANELLDEMGLKWDRKHQYRLRPDGKTLAITIEYVQLEGPKKETCELIKDYWEDVGAKVAVREDQRELYQERGRANERDTFVWHLDWTGEAAMYRDPRRFFPPWSGPANPHFGLLWRNWYDTKGKSGEEPPEEMKRLFALIEEWRTTVPGTEDYREIGRELVTRNVKNLYKIGTVGLAPWPIIVKSDLQNVPEEGFWGAGYGFFRFSGGCQWFFKK